MKTFFFYLGITAGFLLPFFNIPLIWKIRKHKSSKNISLVWAAGVWVCILGMLPQTILSPDWSYKIFGIVNFLFFSATFFFILHYRGSA